ncbi:uncharacterized protein At4g08330, chloroplastic-like [Asparagus officinalis]|uniref:uncharacterized protein At4g08330, chloroplastic-like n=1 Tax=Asparagus officinalis TaxID=4686 RepID=UPI00098E6C6A|nr:uncharacterized protein At4g08330, chloroplastic-like [Asparagus officinalis]
MATLNRLSSKRDVTYRCGSCGYELNLHSSNRNTKNIDYSKYGKVIRKGVVSFVEVDESRFSEFEEIGCMNIFGRRTKLACKKCGNFIGAAYYEGAGDKYKKYDVRISALQPADCKELLQ